MGDTEDSGPSSTELPNSQVEIIVTSPNSDPTVVPIEEQLLNRFSHDGKTEDVRKYLSELTEDECPSKLLQRGGLFGYTPLHEAASEGHYEIVGMLMDRGANADLKTNNGYTCLHLAAAGGHNDSAKVLIQKGANIKCTDEFGRTALESAEVAARMDTLRVMLSAAVIWAAETDNGNLIKELLTRYSRDHLEKGCLQRALLIAVKERDSPETIARIIMKGKDGKDISTEEALKTAVDNHKFRARGMLLMLKAVKENNHDLVLYLYGVKRSKPKYNWISDDEFPLVQEVFKRMEMPTQFAIQLDGSDQDSRVYGEILVRTGVNEKEKVVKWQDLGIKRILTDWLSHIQWVEKIYLSQNRIRSLSQEMSRYLRNVTEVYLEDNEMRSIPPSLLELPNLKKLDLSHNHISVLPEMPQWSPELQELDVSHNRISSLPKKIEAFRLKKLNLGYNQLVTGLECLGSLEKLQYLILEQNTAIERLPKEMGRLVFLKELNLEGLSNLIDPPRLIASSLKDCKRFLRERLKNQKPYYRMKLMMVGQAARGKSTLVKRLQKKHFKEAENESTVGIDVSKWKHVHGSQTVRFAIWDFGGQEVYYATHQCFLTKNSLYLLLWKMTEGKDGVMELKPWLDNIAARVPGSKVMVIGTFFDKLSEEEKKTDARELRQEVNKLLNGYQKYLQIGQVYCVGLHGSRENLDQLPSVIYQEASTYIEQDHYLRSVQNPKKLLGRPIPESYHILDRHLQKIASQFPSSVLEANEYIRTVRDLKLPDLYSEEEIHDATIFLHDMGTLLHFDDRKNNLDNLYFINPQWLFKVISSVVTIKEKNPFVKHGILSFHCLPILFKNLISDKNSQFLNQLAVLFDRFEIALHLDHSKTTLLIPSMLPTVRPLGVGNPPEKHCLLRYIVFPKGAVVPPGFWSRYLARIMHSVPQVKSLLERHTDDGPDLSESGSQYIKCPTSLDSNKSPSQSRPISPLLPISEPQPNRQNSANINCISTDDQEVRFWRTGIFYKDRAIFFRVEGEIFSSDHCTSSSLVSATCEEVSQTSHCITITTLPGTEGLQICAYLTDLCDKLLSEWYQGFFPHCGKNSVQHLIPCVRCLSENKVNPTIFSKEKIVENMEKSAEKKSRCGIHENQPCTCEKYLSEGSSHSTEEAIKNCEDLSKPAKYEVICEHHGNLPIIDVAPDVLLGDLNPKFLLQTSDLEYSKEHQLGKGGFGIVYRGKWRNDDVAIKFYKKDLETALHELRNEATILQRCSHPALAGMVGVFANLQQKPPEFALVLELAPGGALSTPLTKKSHPLPRILFYRMATQICVGLDFLHHQSYIFRDLKAGNILLWSLRLNNVINCKITDFGMTTLASPAGVKTLSGTPGFSAPEVISKFHPAYDQSADSFSFGMVLYQMVARRNPYTELKEKHQIHAAIDKNQWPTLKDVPVSRIGLPYMTLLMKKCWAFNPIDRPSMHYLCGHLRNPIIQLTVGVRSIMSVHSLRSATFCFEGVDSEPKTYTSIHEEVPTIELWVCCDSAKGAELQIFNGETLHHVRTFKMEGQRQLCCMTFHGDFLWLASQDGLCDGSIDVYTARGKSLAHNIKTSDCSPSCMIASNVSVFIGTNEGCVFMLGNNMGKQDRVQLKNRQKFLSSEKINGLLLIKGELWVSHQNFISICSSNSLKEKKKLVLPLKSPHCIGQVALSTDGTVVWGTHLWGITVSAWSVQNKRPLFTRDLHEVLRESYPAAHSQSCIITAMCPVLDTLWCGISTGHILMFSNMGHPLLLLKPFSERIRFIILLPTVGPCRSEKGMVLVGAKGFQQIEGLELDTKMNDLYEYEVVQNDRNLMTTEKLHEPTGTLVLFEAVEAYHAKQMGILHTGNAWSSHDKLAEYNELMKLYDPMKSDYPEPEFPIDLAEQQIKEAIPIEPDTSGDSFYDHSQVGLPSEEHYSSISSSTSRSSLTCDHTTTRCAKSSSRDSSLQSDNDSDHAFSI